MSEKLTNTSPADLGGLGPALRLVLTEKGLRDKFTGVRKELEEAGFSSIQVEDEAIRLVRDWDIDFNQHMAFGLCDLL